VVETQFGYHIIKVTERNEPSTTSLAEATSAIRDRLEQQKVGTEAPKLSADLKKDAKIIYPKGKEPASRPELVLPPRVGTRPSTTLQPGRAIRPGGAPQPGTAVRPGAAPQPGAATRP